MGRVCVATPRYPAASELIAPTRRTARIQTGRVVQDRCLTARMRDRDPLDGAQRVSSRFLRRCRLRGMAFHPPNVLGVSCAAGFACRSRSGAAVAAEELRATTGELQRPGRRHAGDDVGSSAAGPEPGRDSFTPKLGGGSAVAESDFDRVSNAEGHIHRCMFISAMTSCNVACDVYGLFRRISHKPWNEKLAKSVP